MSRVVAEEIFGRDAELAAVRSFVESVPHGPAALLLEGEPGIGKTTLWQAGVAYAIDRCHCVLQSRPVESETKLPFAALGDLLEPVPAEALTPLPAPQRKAVEVALLRAEGEEPALHPRAIALGFLGVLRALSEHGPVIVAVDDVQFLDSPSAAALAFAIRRLESEPLGILLARRAEEGDDDPFDPDRSLPSTRLHRIVVAALALDPLDRLLRTRLEVGLSRPRLAELHRASAGNPFFALEIARALARRALPLAPGEPLPVPPGLRQLVRKRLELLPAGVLETVLVVAALSQATIAAVEAVVGRGELESAVEADIIELSGKRVRLSHPLLGSVPYSELSAERRRELHRTLARVVDDPEERARHLALSTNPPDPDVASALDDAARRARTRGAPEVAAELAERARAFTRTEDIGGVRRRLLEAAGYQFEAGDTARARQLLEEALAASAPGRERAEALTRLAQTHWFGDIRLSAEMFEKAAVEAGDDLVVRIQSELGVALSLCLIHRDLPAAALHARAAVDLARRLGDPSILAQSLAAQAMAEDLLGSGDPIAIAEQATALEASTLPLRVLRHPSYQLAIVLKSFDRYDEARVRLEALLERARERGDENAAPWLYFHLSQTELLAGNWTEASRWADEGYEAALQTGQETVQAVLLSGRALLDAHLGKLDRARATAEEGLALAGRIGIALPKALSLRALGLAELSVGRPAEAHGHLGPLVRSELEAGVRGPGSLRFVRDEIEALIALGEQEEAERLLALLEERARALDHVSVLAACNRCRGLLLASAGELPGALQAGEVALEQHERAPQPFELARTLLVLGALQRRLREKRAARTTLEAAVAAFERLGARHWLEKARMELGRIGGRPSSRGELTPAERRVAALVAEGRSNKEVASGLFVTVSTVEGHLSSIYAKLGIRSRTELARYFAATEAGPRARP